MSTYSQRRAAYWARIAEARQRYSALGAVAGEDGREARRRALAMLDGVYVSGAQWRKDDPEIRRLRRAERRARARQEAS